MKLVNTKIKIVSVKQNIFKLINEIQNNDGFRHSYPLTKERFARLIHRGEFFYVAYYDGKAVGMISVDFEIRAKLHFFSVKQNYQGIGIGTALLTEILKEAKKRNYPFVYVYVEIDSSAEKFLLKRGFKNIGHYHHRYGKDKHANILEISI